MCGACGTHNRYEKHTKYLLKNHEGRSFENIGHSLENNTELDLMEIV
jgi:hypothetical protein